MRRSGLRIGAGLALGIALASSLAAAEPLDPAKADALVAKARKDGDDGFCSAPQRPLSPRARPLCPLVSEVKGCDGLVAACTDDVVPKPPPERTPWSWNGLAGILGTIANVGVWLLIAAVVAAIAWFIVRAIQRGRRDDAATETPGVRPAEVLPATMSEVLETATEAELLLRQAEEHRRRGELDRAVALYLAASLRALDRRGAIRIARHRTNGEYVRSCKDVEAKPELRAIVREVDRVQFGRESATPERAAEVASRAGGIVARAGQAAVVALGALATMALLGGCIPSGGGSHRAMDPAGDDLLFAMLQRGGGNVSRLTTSLATLPMPKEKELAPLVIVDAARVPLEEEARAHLVRWVEAGGRLLLAGDVRDWPADFKAKAATAPGSGAVNVSLLSDDDNDDDDEEDEKPSEVYAAKVASPAALEWPHSFVLAATAKGEVYAAARSFKQGLVIGVAGDDLLTNVGIARAPNAAALVAILRVYASTRKIQIARPEDGIPPPSNPVSALTQAGLGLPLAHAAVAAIVLMLAFGVRQARARTTPPKGRREWTEHIEATGGLYARARLAPLALSAYARFVDGRLRERMPRGMNDPAAFLALRANADPAWTADVWRRASAARAADRPEGDELATLRHLAALYAAALKSE